ncbi:uncharacterized protein LOC143913765 [Arctopsyche grandis]|uniref:uncharacterized protein LOC143913765 n=1 Tax=Arctopsyche grandis TaxID=121162 RepID=UPI00406DA107
MTPPTALESSALAVEAPPDSDDIFGPSRSFPPRSNRPKPSMISAKLRAKEERKKVIQICTEKLEKIKDPDRNLRRSVCINNTYYKLQDEVRREKQMKHMMNANRGDEDESRSRNRRGGTPNAEQKQRMLDKALESIDKELSAIDANMPSIEHEMLSEDMDIVNSLNPLRSGNEDVLNNFVSSQPCMSVTPALLTDELSLDLAFGDRADSYSVNSSKNSDSIDYSFCKSDSSSVNSRCRSRKRSFDEVEDCDVHEVLSQFYMPPTPRLISSIDDDVLLNVVDDDPVEESSKKSKTARSMPEISDNAELDSRKMKTAEFENGFDKMLELDTDLNQNKSDFQTLNSFPSEPVAKRVKYDSSGDYLEPLLQQDSERTPKVEDDKFVQKRASKSEFEIILDALRLEDNKDVCDREDLMYYCGKGDKLVSDGDVRTRYLSSDSCGQAAILGDQQSSGFHGLLASLET